MLEERSLERRCALQMHAGSFCITGVTGQALLSSHALSGEFRSPTGRQEKWRD